MARASEALQIPVTRGRTAGAGPERGGAPPPSWHLTAAIARGDAHAFAAFYEIWFDRVLAMARSASGRDESFCLDVVQDCMMRVVKSLPSLPTEAAVAAWLARALFTTAVDRLRQEQRRRRREREVAQRGDGAVDSGAGLEEDERLAWLRARLAELPATDRALMRERFEVGRTLDQIGAAHGMTGHAAHGRLWRIVARLKRAAQREITDD